MQGYLFIKKSKENFFISGNYFFYFLILGIYFPYFPLYCQHIGFSEKEIGMISALKTFTSIVFPLGFAFLADRFQMHRSVFLLCHFWAALAWAGFFFTESFIFMMLIMGFYGLFHSPLIGFMESFTITFLGKKRSAYGSIRSLGSVGFIFSVWSCGFLLDIWSVESILWLVFSGSIAGFIFAFYIPVKSGKTEEIKKGGMEGLFSSNGLLFLFISFVMLMSHGTYYGFFSIYLSGAGYSGYFIGFCWAIASFAEIGVMLASRFLFQHFTLKGLLIFSFSVAVLRWLILAFSLNPFLIIAAQGLHAITYGVFHMTTILFMDNLVERGAKTTGQTILNASSYGMGLMAGYLISGFGFALWGSGMFFVSAFMAFIGGLCTLALCNPKS